MQRKLKKYELNTPPKELPNLITDLAQGIDKFVALYHATRLNLFDHIKEPQNAASICNSVGIDARMGEKLLNFLVGADFLQERNGVYMLSKTAEVFLISESPYYLGNYIAYYFMHKLSAPTPYDEFLKNGPPPDPQKLWIFDETSWMALCECAASGTIQRILSEVNSTLPVSSISRILDLGGGHGLFSIAYTTMNPHATATLFDFPETVERAKKIILEARAEEKVKVLPGDMTKDDIGSDYDLIYASDSLYLPYADVTSVIGKIYSAVKPGGFFVLKSAFMEKPIRSSSKSALIFDLMTGSMNEQDHVYQLHVMEDLLTDAGFAIISRKEVMDLEDKTTLSILQKN